MLFLIHDENGIGLNVEFPNKSLSFGNLNIMESVVDCLFVHAQRQFLLHICILIVVMFLLLQEKNFFVVFLLLFFLLIFQVVWFY